MQFRLSSNSFRVCTFKELNILKSNEMKKFVFVIPRTQQCHPFELNQSLFLLNYGPKLCEVCSSSSSSSSGALSFALFGANKGEQQTRVTGEETRGTKAKIKKAK